MVVTTASTCLIGVNDLTVGAGTTTGGGTYTVGDPVSLVATVKTGFLFVNWTVLGIQVSTSSTYNFNAPAIDTTYVANFTQEVVVATTTGGLGIEIDLTLDGIDIASYQKIQPSTGSLGIEVDLNLESTFDASVYQVIKLTSGALGIKVDLNLDLFQAHMSKNIARVPYTSPLPNDMQIFDPTKMHNSFSYNYNLRNAFGSFKFTTNSDHFYIRMNPTYIGRQNMGLFINGTFSQNITVTNNSTRLLVTIAGGGTNTIEIVEGLLNKDNDILTNLVGTDILEVWVAKTSTTTVIQPTTVAKKIVWVGDSILVGYGTTEPTTKSFARLFKLNSGVEIATIGAAWDSLRNDVSGVDPTILANTIARIQALLTNSSLKTVVIEVGSNDYNLTTPADYTTFMTNLVTGIHAVDASIKILLIGEFTRFSQAETVFATSFRPAKQAIATANSSYCSYANGPTLSPNYPSNYPDLSHPNDAENLIIYNNLISLMP
jgi:lysophospholipase L1-like esterase